MKNVQNLTSQNLQMSEQSLKDESPAKTTQNTEFAEVLYQRLGDRWYAFSLIEDEVYFSRVDDELIEQKKAAPTFLSPEANRGIERKGNA